MPVSVPGAARPFITILLLAWCLVFPGRCPAMEIELRGVPSDIAEPVRNSVQVQTAQEQAAPDRHEAERRMDRGRKQLKTAMSAFGFYRARVRATLRGDPEGWKAVYDVTPGQQVTYRSVTLKVTGPARDEKSLGKYVSGKPLAVGAPVVHERYETVKNELLNRTIALGYLNASFAEHRVEVDLDANRADATIIVDSGPLFRFGEIRLNQDVLRDDFVRRFIRIDRGERYSDQKLLRVEQDLQDSDYFSEVRVEPRLNEAGPNGYVPIDVTLSAKKPSEYQLGAGFGTDTGLRGSLSWQNSRINRRGHRLGSSLQLSQIGAEVEGHYTIPFGDPRRERYKVFAGYTRDEPDTNDSRLGQLGVSRLTMLGRTQLELSMTYQREDFTVAGQTGLTDLFVPAVSVSRVVADNRLFTRNGLQWRASVQGAAGIISDFAFVQPHVSGKLIHSLGDLRVILRGEAAMTAAQLENLPASIRFFAGGDRSVRGYGYETLGPRNDQGDVTGGRHLLVGSAEVDYGITGNWRVAAFVDAGNAFDDFQDREPLRKSVGIGIRRITPIGPIRIDLAHPLSGGNGVRLHITLGPDL